MRFVNFLIISIVLLLMQYSILIAQDKYVYHLNPDMPEWKSLPVDVKNKMLQIPEEKLISMTTEMLIQAYLDNPFCSLMIFYTSPQERFNRVYKEFNGLRELIVRKDVATKLIEYYKNMQVDGYDPNWQPIERAQFRLKFLYIETLLSQIGIISMLNHNEVSILISELMRKFYKKIEPLNEYPTCNLESSIYVIAHILNHNYKFFHEFSSDKDVEYFLETGQVIQSNLFNKILQKAKTFTQK